MRRSARKSLLPVIAALTASGALLTAGCGGDDDSDQTAAPAAWVDVVCGGIDGWVKAGLAVPKDRSTNEATKQAHLSFIDSVVAAYSEANTKLIGLGKPDVPNGDQRQTEALRLFQGAKSALDAQRGQLDRLDVNAPDFDAVYAEIARPLTEMQQLITTITSDPDLTKSFQDSQACQAVRQNLGAP